MAYAMDNSVDILVKSSFHFLINREGISGAVNTMADIFLHIHFLKKLLLRTYLRFFLSLCPLIGSKERIRKGERQLRGDAPSIYDRRLFLFIFFIMMAFRKILSSNNFIFLARVSIVIHL